MKVSEGCRFCYAERFAERFRGVEGHPYEQGFDLRLVPEKLQDPFKFKPGTKVFVNSMSDLFLEEIPDDYIDSALGVAALCPEVTFQVLTKRARRMREYFEVDYRWALIEGSAQRIHHDRTGEDPSMWLAVHELPNVWFGISVEDKKRADERIPELLATPGIALRFISAEPLLGELELDAVGRPWLTTEINHEEDTRLDRVIVGGESGPRRRPMDLAWARSIRDDCFRAGVPFFMKQIDKKTPIPDDLLVRQFPVA